SPYGECEASRGKAVHEYRVQSRWICRRRQGGTEVDNMRRRLFPTMCGGESNHVPLRAARDAGYLVSTVYKLQEVSQIEVWMRGNPLRKQYRDQVVAHTDDTESDLSLGRCNGRPVEMFPAESAGPDRVVRPGVDYKGQVWRREGWWRRRWGRGQAIDEPPGCFAHVEQGQLCVGSNAIGKPPQHVAG